MESQFPNVNANAVLSAEGSMMQRSSTLQLFFVGSIGLASSGTGVRATTQYSATPLPEPIGTAASRIRLAETIDIAETPNDTHTAVGSYRLTGHADFQPCVWTRDSMMQWTVIPLPTALGIDKGDALSIGCSDADNCVIVGYTGPESNPQPACWTKTNGGAWTLQSVPLPMGTDGGQVNTIARFGVDWGMGGIVYLDDELQAVTWKLDTQSGTISTDWIIITGTVDGNAEIDASRCVTINGVDQIIFVGYLDGMDGNPRPHAWQADALGNPVATELPQTAAGLGARVFGLAVVDVDSDGDADTVYFGVERRAGGIEHPVIWREVSGVWVVEGLGVPPGYINARVTGALNRNGMVERFIGTADNGGDSAAYMWEVDQGNPNPVLMDSLMSPTLPVVLSLRSVVGSETNVFYIGGNVSSGGASEPHAYVLVDLNPVPAMGTVGIIASVLFIIVVGASLSKRRSLRTA